MKRKVYNLLVIPMFLGYFAIVFTGKAEAQVSSKSQVVCQKLKTNFVPEPKNMVSIPVEDIYIAPGGMPGDTVSIYTVPAGYQLILSSVGVGQTASFNLSLELWENLGGNGTFKLGPASALNFFNAPIVGLIFAPSSVVEIRNSGSGSGTIRGGVFGYLASVQAQAPGTLNVPYVPDPNDMVHISFDTSISMGGSVPVYTVPIGKLFIATGVFISPSVGGVKVGLQEELGGTVVKKILSLGLSGGLQVQSVGYSSVGIPFAPGSDVEIFNTSSSSGQIKGYIIGYLANP